METKTKEMKPEEFLNHLKAVLKNRPQLWLNRYDDALDFAEIEWFINHENNGILDTHIGDFRVEDLYYLDDGEAGIVFRLEDDTGTHNFIIYGTYDDILREYNWNNGNPVVLSAVGKEEEFLDEETGETYTMTIWEEK